MPQEKQLSIRRRSTPWSRRISGRWHRTEVHRHVEEAREVLRHLGMPLAQTNDRSALTLLALLDLAPDRSWLEIANPRRGITPLMDFMAKHYLETPYAPNTRE